MRRRIGSPFSTPVSGLQGGKAGSKNARNFVSGNAPGQQWDIRQFSRDRAALDNSQPSQYSAGRVGSDGLPDYAVQTIPTRVNMGQWSAKMPTANEPILLIPRNPKRISLLIVNPQAAPLSYSFGKPASTDGAGAPLMAVLGAQSSLPFFGESCPINDIWVLFPLMGASVISFEGTEAAEGNL